MIRVPLHLCQKNDRQIEVIDVWVNDLLFASSHNLMNKMKLELKLIYEVTNLGESAKIVGIEIEHNQPAHRTIMISQK